MMLSQGEVPILVALGLLASFVDASVHLDHQPQLGAEEVDDEGSDPLLAAELQSEDLPTSEQFPQHVFRRRLSAPEIPRNLQESGEIQWL